MNLRQTARLEHAMLEIHRALGKALRNSDFHGIRSHQALLIARAPGNEVFHRKLLYGTAYFGENLSHNVAKLLELGYFAHHSDKMSDRRCTPMVVTRRGLDLQELVARVLGKISLEELGLQPVPRQAA